MHDPQHPLGIDCWLAFSLSLPVHQARDAPVSVGWALVHETTDYGFEYLVTSFYDEVIRLLARRGFEINPERLNRDWTQPTTHDPSVEAAWLAVYRDPSHHWDLYEMAEELVDLEDAFRQWRFRHVTTVERIIGFKGGTGGTAGAAYLRKMLDVVLFPELWHVRTVL